MPALTIGLDIAKNVYQFHGADHHGKVAIQDESFAEVTC